MYMCLYLCVHRYICVYYTCICFNFNNYSYIVLYSRIFKLTNFCKKHCLMYCILLALIHNRIYYKLYIIIIYNVIYILNKK